MSIKLHLLTIVIFCLITFKTKAQEIACDAFCLTGVRMDTTVPNLMYVTLFFTGSDNDFINYPWIADVINAQGDTIGHGTWNFFGQFGNTSTDYPVTVGFDTLPADFKATMVFYYDTSVCILSFPCTMTALADVNQDQSIRINPNPFSTETKVLSDTPFDDLTIHIFNVQGLPVKQISHQHGNEISIQRDDLAAGIYFVQLVERNRGMGMWRVVVY